MLNEYKLCTKSICKKKGWVDLPIECLWLLFVEEVGELASAVRRATNQFKDRKKINVESELMDVFSYLFQLADVLNVNLDEEMEKYLKQYIHIDNKCLA